MKENLKNICQVIDWLSEKSGFIVSLLFFPGWILVLYSVIARYFFNTPTMVAGEYAKYLFAIYFVIGGAYCLLKKAHIRVDVIYNLLNKKIQTFIEVFFVFPIFLAFVFPFIWHGSIFAWTSIKILETDPPPTHILLFPIKIMIPIAGLLLLLQGLADLYRYCFSNNSKEEESHAN